MTAYVLKELAGALGITVAGSLIGTLAYVALLGGCVMDDRELLEMAAKAAAIGGGWGDKIEYHNGAVDLRDVWILEGDGFVPWNPLHDDGDALRLAAGLCLNVLSSEACVVVEDEKGVECIEYFYGPEDYTSGWRRAIVRAAAAIGRAM